MKSKIRILFVLLAMVLIICSANIYAADSTETVDKKAILEKIIPGEITIDVTQYEGSRKENGEYKAVTLVKEQIDKILKENENVANIKYSLSINYRENDVKTAQFFVQNTEIGTEQSYSKNITITYSGEDKYNTADAEAIKAKTKDLSFFEGDLIYDYGTSYIEKASAEVEKQVMSQINDSSIKVTYYEDKQQTPDPFGFSAGIILFSKNDIIYYAIGGQINAVPVITVPNDVENSEKANFNFLIEKAKGENEYTFYYRNNDMVEAKLIIKSEAKKVEEVDEKTNVKLEANTDVIPEDTEMIVEEISTESKTFKEIREEIIRKNSAKNIIIFDITLMSNSAKIQPNGKVKISMPIPSTFDSNNLVVFRIDEDKNVIEYDVTVITENGKKYAQFETDHFSNYALVEKVAKAENGEEEATEKDVTPKTGIENGYLALAAIVSLASLGGIYFLKRK